MTLTELNGQGCEWSSKWLVKEQFRTNPRQMSGARVREGELGVFYRQRYPVFVITSSWTHSIVQHHTNLHVSDVTS